MSQQCQKPDEIEHHENMLGMYEMNSYIYRAVSLKPRKISIVNAFLNYKI